jgi:quinoprotein glucose dehydrogenase
MSRARLVILVSLASPVAAQAPAPKPIAEWPAYGRDPEGSRFSPLTEITPANVANLRIAWRYSTGEASGPETKRPTSLEATPIVVDGTLYFSTPLGRIIALDPETGARRWVFDAKVGRDRTFGDWTSRGVSTWLDPEAKPGAPCRRRIVAATVDARLFSLDAASGALCRKFGSNGMVDLRRGLRNAPFELEEYEVTSPPAVVGNVIVVGSGVADNNRTEAASGEVRAFDARTGRLRWTWDPVPQSARDPAYATWQGADAHRTGAGNAWSVIAADTRRDLVVIPTGSASPDYYGGKRLGQNRYANSVVALRASTGQLVWSFQTVHHDLWDYDNAAPPALVTVTKGSTATPVVLQATKSGMLYVLNLKTGQPLWPVEERLVPASDVVGEQAWPSQPFSTIEPLSPQRIPRDQLWGATDSDRVSCQTRLGRLRNEGVFTPPSLTGTLVVPSNIGGAHWGGLVFDSSRQLAIIPVNRLATEVRLIPREKLKSVRDSETGSRISAEYTDMHGTPFVMRREIVRGPSGLPCTPPPFGELVAVSLVTGRAVWRVPSGTLPALPGSAAAPPAAWGSPALGGPIATASGLVFMAATPDRFLRAYETATGRELWKGALPAAGKATPMTYRARPGGRQFVVIAAGSSGGLWGKGDELIAFALPED